MRKTLLVALTLAAGIGAVTFAAPTKESFGTAKEAEALVAKAVAHIRAVGKEKAYREFTNKYPQFVDRDLYVVVYDLEGVVLAHGQHAKMVGENLIGTRDPAGKLWIKERVDLARSKGKFWHDYRFMDPISKKTLDKSSYCERLESSVVCVGIYKR
jgi:cytochrome c